MQVNDSDVLDQNVQVKLMNFRVPVNLYNKIKLLSLIENIPMTELVFTEKFERAITKKLEAVDPVIVKHFMQKYADKDAQR